MKKLLLLIVLCLQAITLAAEKEVEIYIRKFTGEYYRKPKTFESCGSVTILFTENITLTELMQLAASKGNISKKKQRHMFLTWPDGWMPNPDLTCGRHRLQNKDCLYLYIPLDSPVIQFFRILPGIPGALLFRLFKGL